MIIQGNDPYTQPSFSLGNRIGRALWGMVWLLLFRPSPRPFHAWRRLLLRLFGAQLGQHVNVYPNVKIWAPWQLKLGNKVGIADGVTLYNMATIVIGDYCVVSQGAHLCAGSHDIDSANFQLIAKPIVLEKDVWICAEAFVGPGVSVAEGCVLGARAVVVKSIVEPWSVWAGNPAVMKRTRNKGLMQ
jgi:putative colanic acid biosynthesis acetyltransferase WcaF